MQIQKLDRNNQNAPVLTMLISYLDMLCKPNNQLGRPGAVCPFTAKALKEQSLYFAIISGREQENQIRRAIGHGLKKFPNLNACPRNKALFIIFPDFKQEDYQLLETEQAEFRIHFLKRKLMLGVFHPEETSGGLHNDQFQPSVSPLPMLVIRGMQPEDKKFFEAALSKNPTDFNKLCLEIHQGFFPEVY